MTKEQLQLINLINESFSPRKEDNGEILVWVEHYHMEEFYNLIGYNYFCEGGIEANFQGNCVCFDIIPIIEYFGIDEECINLSN